MYRNSKLFSRLFTAPALIIYFVFVIIPVFISIYYSFFRWDGMSEMVFKGFSNYQYLLFKWKDYWVVTKNTGILIVVGLLVQMPLGLIFAYFLYRGIKGFKFVRAVTFLPVVIAPITVGVMFGVFFNSDIGPFNMLLEKIGLSVLQTNWMSDPKTVLGVIIYPLTWQYLGIYIIIFLAAMQGISNDVLEASIIDGANSFVIFKKIILPLLWDVTQICIILCVTGGLKAFDQPLVMTMGGPGVHSTFLALLMYRYGFYENQIGLASGISVTILIMALAFSYLFKKYLSKDFEA